MSATASSVAPVLERTDAASWLDRDELRAFLTPRLAAFAGRERTLVISVPAPVAAPEALLRLSSRPLGFLWHPPAGIAFAGSGASHRVELAGRDRFVRLRRDAEAIFRRLETIDHPAFAEPGFAEPVFTPPSPRLFGGLAFAVGAAADEPWRAFGDGCFTLPRLRYASDGRCAALTLTVRGEDELDAELRERWIARVERVLVGLAAAGVAGDPGDGLHDATRESFGAIRAPLDAVRAVHPPPLGRWTAQVEAIRAAIAAGRYRKIVAAHRTEVELAHRLRPSRVLRRLENGLHASTRFAFCRPGETFLGATPERLVALAGTRLETEALAGSIESGGARGALLLASTKDRGEHQLVVEQIVRRLGPLCSSLEVPAVPGIRTLRDVLHLHTPITGNLRAPRHVLDLVELLHPTPAVGGVPAEAALAWIAEHEAEGRGWYAGPIGWFDAAGDGDFAVALRACVLREKSAYLYAGAGIVADSDPTLEYRETELKMRSLMAALGAPS